MQKAYLNPTPDQTFEIVGDGPYNFTRVLAHTRELEAAGNVEDACNERYQAFQRLAGLLPEDEEINLEWSHRNSQSALELIRASAIDHFLINDFEMSAALLEMLLELDPEDHLEGSELLAFDYLAMDEQELFDEVINDVSDKCASRGILLLWSAFRREGTLPEGELLHVRYEWKDDIDFLINPTDEYYSKFFLKKWDREMVCTLFPPRGLATELGRTLRAAAHVIGDKLRRSQGRRPLLLEEYKALHPGEFK